MNMIEDQKEFMKAAGQTVGERNHRQMDLYTLLIDEEHEEFMDEDDAVNELKEAADMLVVILGWFHSTGVPVEKVWNLVHANNMLKVTGEKEYDENGKVMKSQSSIDAKAKMMKELSKLVDKAKIAGV